jgi:hypothetical protein
MVLTADNAREVLQVVLGFLREVNAREVLDGIDETRRIGIEEHLSEGKGAELKQVARTRRRPPTDQEMLEIVFARLNQRLIILPLLASSIESRLGSEDVRWRVDTEFSSVDRFPDASLQDLLPTGFQEVSAMLTKLSEEMTPADVEI